MVSQDRAKQERLLHFAGWLHHRHGFQTRVAGKPYTEVHFTRADLSDIPALSVYGLEAGDAGERTLLRDVADLSTFGMEISWSASSREWVSRKMPLTDAECRALATAALSVIVEDGSSTPQGFHLPGAAISAEGAELIMAYAPITDTIIEAIRVRTPIRIEHRHRHRTVDPWHVVVADGRWYLIGRDHDANAERAFSLDAITSVEQMGTSTAFEVPARDIPAIVARVGDPDRWIETAPVDVHLSVHPRLVTRAEELLGATAVDVPEPGGWTPMTCTIRNVDVFLHRLWGMRARAVVMGPESIRERVVSTLEEMA